MPHAPPEARSTGAGGAHRAEVVGNVTEMGLGGRPGKGWGPPQPQHWTLTSSDSEVECGAAIFATTHVPLLMRRHGYPTLAHFFRALMKLERQFLFNG